MAFFTLNIQNTIMKNGNDQLNFLPSYEAGVGTLSSIGDAKITDLEVSVQLVSNQKTSPTAWKQHFAELGDELNPTRLDFNSLPNNGEDDHYHLVTRLGSFDFRKGRGIIQIMSFD